MDYQTFEAITILAVLLAGGSFFMALAGLICWFFGLRDPKPMATYKPYKRMTKDEESSDDL